MPVIRGVYINNQLIVQQINDSYVDAKGVIDLVGRPWPRYLSTIGYSRILEQLAYLTPVYREFLPSLKKRTKFCYWFHPELVLAIVYSEAPHLGNLLRTWLDTNKPQQPLNVEEQIGKEEEIQQFVDAFLLEDEKQ